MYVGRLEADVFVHLSFSFPAHHIIKYLDYKVALFSHYVYSAASPEFHM